ncbi:dihydroxyacetone kinase Dak1 [Paraconiothyrium brasiliense]|uniref:Dihydroxyacetone kinase Dak1 n=1 Tax=Paraconiothyrium brasiliense TaxID=300254 RepID=A0ABR3QMZ6_9PLEO
MCASLKDVSRIAQLAADHIVSIGSSLSHVHVPGRTLDGSEDELKESEIEIGMGIHNEPGSERQTTDLPELVKTMLSYCLDKSDKDRSFLNISEQDEVVLLVNNLGGVSVLELAGITNEVVEQLASDWTIKPVRILSGTYMTSLNGLGFSISLLKVMDTGLGADSSMIKLLDATAEATGWTATVSSDTWAKGAQSAKARRGSDEDEVESSNLRRKHSIILGQANTNIVSVDYGFAVSALKTGLERLIAAEPDVTKYDTIVGDGDCGIGLKRGAEGISVASFRSRH